MSELEQAVQPLLTPMLHGAPKILDVDRQTMLATWAFKCAVVFEFLYPRERAIQPDQAAALVERREVPPHTRVWIASYRGTDHNAFYRHNVLQPNREKTETVIQEHDEEDALPPPVAYTMTLGIRHVAFLVVGSTDPAFGVSLGGLASRAFESIWPVRQALTWPPDAAIDDRSLPAVLDMFGAAGR